MKKYSIRSFMLLSPQIVSDILHIGLVVKMYRNTQILISIILHNIRILIDPILPLIHPPKNSIPLQHTHPQLTHLLTQIVNPLSHQTHLPPQIVQLLVEQHRKSFYTAPFNHILVAYSNLLGECMVASQVARPLRENIDLQGVRDQNFNFALLPVFLQKPDHSHLPVVAYLDINFAPHLYVPILLRPLLEQFDYFLIPTLIYDLFLL